MIMCERIERLVVNEFEKLTGVNASENQVMKFEVFPQKREALKQLLRSVLPDLRIYSSVGLVTVADFANYIEKAEEKKKTFFDRGLQIIREATGNENLTCIRSSGRQEKETRIFRLRAVILLRRTEFTTLCRPGLKDILPIILRFRNWKSAGH